MTVSNLLIYIIKSAISSQEIKINQQEVDWEALYQLADYHSVANYLVYAMTADTPAVYREKAQKAYSLSMVRSAKYDMENALTFNAFEENGISYMPLKGYYMKKYYPSSEMRTMCDIDVLIKEDEVEKVESVMSALGYLNKDLDRSDQITYDKPPLCSYEMHLNLVSPTHKIIGGYYMDPWRFAKKDEDNSYGYHMSDEDFFIFQLAHYTKHYTTCGVGIRPVIDIFLFMKHFKDKLDWSYIDAQLDKMCMKAFCHKVIELGEFWFAEGEADETVLAIAKQTMSSGIYGNDTMIATTKTMKAKNPVVYKIKKAFTIAFPRRKAMEHIFPTLKKHPYLLPFFWIKRLIEKIFTGKGSEYIASQDNSAEENSKNIRSHFDSVGLGDF